MYDAYRATSFFRSLDGLRALSIAAVIAFHVWDARDAIPFAENGDLGVNLFFVISGFLITTLLLRERQRHGNISLRAFYGRRTLRIFPLYYTVLAIYTVLVLVLERDTNPGAEFIDHLPAYLTYTSNLFVPLESGRVIFYFAWSLACEEQFYLMWPWVEGLAPPRVASRIAVSVLLGLQLLHFTFVDSLPAGVSITLRSASWIFGGVCLAHALHDRRAFRLLAWALGRRWSSTAVFVVTLALLWFKRTTAPHAAAIMLAFMALVCSCVIREDHALSRILRLRPIAWMGTVSYGMYLLHMLCVTAARRLLAQFGLTADAAVFAGALALTCLVAGLSFRYYESRFLPFKRHFVRPKPDVPVPATAPAR